jgi:broad specificity polyphosphatase/5'/3'-nucleotidase SurE
MSTFHVVVSRRFRVYASRARHVVSGVRSFERTDPHGRGYFWLTGAFQNAEPHAEDSDEWALAHRYVSVVPVQTDMTDYRQLAALEGVL